MPNKHALLSASSSHRWLNCPPSARLCDDPAYANAYFINANSSTAPGIVDADCNPILTRSDVYSGVYGRASIKV